MRAAVATAQEHFSRLPPLVAATKIPLAMVCRPLADVCALVLTATYAPFDAVAHQAAAGEVEAARAARDVVAEDAEAKGSGCARGS